MKLDTAETKALILMKQHGLLKEGWQFKFDRAKKRFGYCSGKRKVISLSELLTELNDEVHVIDTILHEIAHALVGVKEGHNEVWKRKAIEIGCNGKRCYDTEAGVVEPEMNYTLLCGTCDFRVGRERMRNWKVACPCCCKKYNNGRYSEEYEMVVVFN